MSALETWSVILGGIAAGGIVARTIWRAGRWAVEVLTTLSSILTELKGVTRVQGEHERRIAALERRRGA